MSKSVVPVKNNVETHEELKCDIDQYKMEVAQDEELAKVRNYNGTMMNEYGMMTMMMVMEKNEMRPQYEDVRQVEVTVKQDFRYSAGHGAQYRGERETDAALEQKRDSQQKLQSEEDAWKFRWQQKCGRKSEKQAHEQRQPEEGGGAALSGKLGGVNVEDQEVVQEEQVHDEEKILKEIAVLLDRMKHTEENDLQRQRLKSELQVKQERLNKLRVLRRQVERVVPTGEHEVPELLPEGGVAR